MTARPNSKTNGTRSLRLWLLTPILIILAVIISSSCSGSGGAAAKSSQSEITELTVTINSIDYPITFEANNAATVTIPFTSTPPTAITTISAAISTKASGLAANDILNLSSGKTNITITAEDGTSTVYTLNVEIEAPLIAAVQARSEKSNSRTHILPFTIKASSADAEGEYRLAAREAGSPVPTATDIRSSSAVIVRSLTAASINVFLSFHMDTDLFDGAKVWTDTLDTSILTYGMVDAALLQPETEYRLCAAASSGSDTVYTLLTHSTDAEPEPSLAAYKFYSSPIEHTYTIRKGEPFLLWVGIVNVASSFSFSDNHYQIQDDDKTLNLVLITSGISLPAISPEDSSAFFAAKIDNKIGRYVMVSKNTHTNTESAVSGMNFRITSVHGSDVEKYYFIWE